MNFFSSVGRYIRSLFFQGLFALLPIILTLALIHTSIRMARHWLAPIVKILPPQFLQIPFIEIIVVLGLVLIFGFILKSFFFAQLAHYVESLIEQIPFVKQIYTSIKQLVTAFNTKDNGALNVVVLVEYPQKIYALGFLTGQLPAELSPQQGIPFFTVFIPASLNPTSGYMIVAQEGQLTRLPLSRQDAMQFIVSGGIITPAQFKKS